MCRSAVEDFLYAEELQGYVADGTLRCRDIAECNTLAA
jgi:sulfite reductase alpha subunit-like flavoprotein